MYKSFPAPKWSSSLILLFGFLFGVLSSITNVVNAVPADIPNVPDLSNPNISNPTTTVAQSSSDLTPHEIVVGAYAIILGVDMFVRTGFAQSVVTFLDGNGNHNLPSYETNPKIYIMLAAMVVAFILGMLFQYRFRTEKFYPQGRVPHYRNVGDRLKNVGKKEKQLEKSEHPTNRA
ncbi:16716_t:CDS:2 [Racocetra fulgida]|uniref:16716_t:CDS:1 n=1 Tax=Racocetra fulgida TaxID=60492 RepID=A0A9N9GRG8_9GLOM|nr:16716_t:CDS:2 [Racocetra fulgida]